MLFGQRMVHGAETQNHLHEGQWGSRPGRSAHDALLSKILLYRVARLTCTPLATFDNDAKSYYGRIVMTFTLMLCQKHGVPRHFRQRCQVLLQNRIVMTFALMLCQKHGVPQSVCMMAAISLLMAEYSIKTKDGLSTGT